MSDETEQLNGYVAANVRRLREKHGLTQEGLAERADLAWTYVQRIESGNANPTVKVLASLARALEVSPGRLFRVVRPITRKLGRPRKKH